MVTTMFDAEKFIKEVEAQPAIWNSDLENFNNRLFKRRAWEEVARKMCASFESFTERNRSNIIDDLQKKWRNYRDYHIKLKKSGKVVKRKSSYLSLMSFLDGNITNNVKKTSKKISDSDDDSESHKSRHGESHKSGHGESHKSRHGRENENETSQVQDRTPEFVETSLNQNVTNVASYFEDPDRSFLLSLLPDMKSMDEKQKFLFKVEVMKIIQKFNYSDEMYLEISETSSHDPLVHPKFERMDDFDVDNLH